MRHACVPAGRAVGEGRSPASWLGDALAEALDGVRDAARALANHAVALRSVVFGGSARASTTWCLLAAHRHAHVLRQLHVADPDHALAGAPPWQLVNLITACRSLLTPSPA